MTVQNVIDQARTGELRGIAIKDSNESIINYINLGLLELYKRFPLETKEHLIEMVDGTEIYKLPDDFMWIVAAYDELDELDANIVSVVPVNEEDNPASINLVSWNEVQIPVTATGAYMSIIYVAAPVVLTEGDLAKAIPIPPQMIEALLHYIGYRAHGSIDGNVQAENSTHYQRFEISCERMQQMGMYSNDDASMRDRISMRGFV